MRENICRRVARASSSGVNGVSSDWRASRLRQSPSVMIAPPSNGSTTRPEAADPIAASHTRTRKCPGKLTPSTFRPARRATSM